MPLCHEKADQIRPYPPVNNENSFACKFKKTASGRLKWSFNYPKRVSKCFHSCKISYKNKNNGIKHETCRELEGRHREPAMVRAVQHALLSLSTHTHARAHMVQLAVPHSWFSLYAAFKPLQNHCYVFLHDELMCCAQNQWLGNILFVKMVC